jgi:hypothetical protein
MKKKATNLKRRSVKKKLAKKKEPAKRKSSKTKKTAPKKAVVKGKSAAKKMTRSMSSPSQKRPRTESSRAAESFAFGIRRTGPRAGQSGDLQGLSGRQGADSESVEELMEEGNAFEADVVAGVERAGDSRREVHAREISEDDVPEEYLDED